MRLVSRASALIALFMAAGCASDYSPVAAPTAPQTSAAGGSIDFFTAGPGEILVVSDRCTAARCPNPDQPRYGELVYLGMRSADSAVFRLTETDTAPAGPLVATHVPHLFVVDRPETPVSQGAFIPARAMEAPIDPAVTEIVVNPVAGVAFGTDHVEIVIASATPARVVYTVEPTD